MKKLTLCASILLGLLFIWKITSSITLAQSVISKQPITFNSFTGIYYLSRDASNHSLLTTQETILADFPSSGNYSGITRSIPQTYQGRSVKVKVNSVTDAGGGQVPFKVAPDEQGNLVITTGDSAITIYGSQTFHINYQTRDVVDTTLSTDQFLLDINGRGWQQPFGKVSGVIHIPKNFATGLIGKPSFYICYLKKNTNDCIATTQNNSSETIVSIKSLGIVGANHALVAKINFRTATFSVKQSIWSNWYVYMITAMVLGIGYFTLRRKKISTS